MNNNNSNKNKRSNSTPPSGAGGLIIINYGAGNIQSLKFAFKRLGVEAVLSDDAEEIRAADRIIFPGVGEASSAMAKLRSTGLDEVIPTLKQPVLGICLGMQLMCRHSTEGDTKGLGIFDVDVVRFGNAFRRKEEAVKVPQIGWNEIFDLKSPLFKDVPEQSFMYLVHSYYAEQCSETIATTNYGLDYASALQKDNFYGVQFHPEKSAKAGAKILENFCRL